MLRMSLSLLRRGYAHECLPSTKFNNIKFIVEKDFKLGVKTLHRLSFHLKEKVGESVRLSSEKGRTLAEGKVQLLKNTCAFVMPRDVERFKKMKYYFHLNSPVIIKC